MKFGSKGKKSITALVVGLDNSGKSSIVNQFKPKKMMVKEITPTVGFKIEEFKAAGTSWKMYDMSGQGRYRNLWSKFYQEIEAVVFVVDASDRLRMVVAREELKTVIESPELSRAPVLVLLNKTDVAGHEDSATVMDLLELPQLLASHTWTMMSASAVKDEGLEDALSWIVSSVRT
ncbi:Small GTPase superfamily, ARF/SAR type [Carpediemonas membranifera]|uniref:Small GTPase superfamily, ARF/SAR type n=1 Tax=Carpediemonas membranifera TaxID=201153 RepID=A0A8J6BVJ0_9EUKA|nr:Small GTPase superfamily, ARF/SAR type [Carpediemonas membranifera]|eukprot:KAG9391461.1 Small GTPase superfamily, ARF/SAR type [Carpediemonas membranifera]